METQTIILIVAAVIVFIIIPLMMYNSLINKRNQVLQVFSNIDALLKKRYDLIPNLVTAVQQYMQHERKTLNEITELRTKALDKNLSDDEKVDLNNKISRHIGGIMVAVENYPDLKASSNFLQLQAALNEVEEQISAARRAYNAVVTAYNNAVQMFPTNIIASMMKFKSRQFFEIEQYQRENHDLKNLFNK